MRLARAPFFTRAGAKGNTQHAVGGVFTRRNTCAEGGGIQHAFGARAFGSAFSLVQGAPRQCACAQTGNRASCHACPGRPRLQEETEDE